MASEAPDDAASRLRLCRSPPPSNPSNICRHDVSRLWRFDRGQVTAV
jgi:hypothetical protein